MVAVCRRTSLVVITPQIAIVERLRNCSRRILPATCVPPAHEALRAPRPERDNLAGSAQSPGMSACLQIASAALHHDSAVISGVTARKTGNFDRQSPVRRADRLHSPFLTMLCRKSRQGVEYMARRTTRRGRGNLEAG